MGTKYPVRDLSVRWMSWPAPGWHGRPPRRGTKWAPARGERWYRKHAYYGSKRVGDGDWEGGGCYFRHLVPVYTYCIYLLLVGVLCLTDAASQPARISCGR